MFSSFKLSFVGLAWFGLELRRLEEDETGLFILRQSGISRQGLISEGLGYLCFRFLGFSVFFCSFYFFLGYVLQVVFLQVQIFIFNWQRMVFGVGNFFSRFVFSFGKSFEVGQRRVVGFVYSCVWFQRWVKSLWVQKVFVMFLLIVSFYSGFQVRCVL